MAEGNGDDDDEAVPQRGVVHDRVRLVGTGGLRQLDANTTHVTLDRHARARRPHASTLRSDARRL